MQKLFNLALTMAIRQSFPLLAAAKCEYRFRKKAVERKEVAGRRNVLQVGPGGIGPTVLLCLTSY